MKSATTAALLYIGGMVTPLMKMALPFWTVIKVATYKPDIIAFVKSFSVYLET